ncbi:MAG: hypothetical protein ACREA0_33380 [bacterium]
MSDPLESGLCEPVAASRQWTLRDDNQGHHHGVVRLSESPLYLALSWKETAADPEQPVGVFRLDLRGLLEAGYIRHDPVGSSGDDVRLRVVRRADGTFWIQAKDAGPALEMHSST